MVIGKGSLFLGRMTGLFDGVSFILQRNGREGAGSEPVIAVTGPGCELGEEAVVKGAEAAAGEGRTVLYIGRAQSAAVPCAYAGDEDEAHGLMKRLLDEGKADAAVTMHYAFPIGVSTVARVAAPGTGKALYIATTTGASSADRVVGMVTNAIYGVIAAKACGVASPAVGLLNLDGARRAEAILRRLRSNGYPLRFADSGRDGGGPIMRGNDLLAGSCDVIVTDPLTGNLLVKTLNAYSTGGAFESAGSGYGPGIGRGEGRLVMIVSRASGPAAIAGAVGYAAELIKGDYRKIAAAEFVAADAAGLNELLGGGKNEAAPVIEAADMPPKEAVTAEIAGIEIFDLEDAAKALAEAGIYAASGMGCTGPVILVNETKKERALNLLSSLGFSQISEGS
jgi:hypothetical protein